MTIVALLRHPATQAAAGRCYGRSDVALQPGWQAALPGWIATLRGVDVHCVRSSPLGRCLEPAEALATALHIPLQVDARLAELDFGEWEGRLWDEVPREALDRWAADPLGFAAPGGEIGAALVARVQAVLADLRDAARSCLVVSHGGPLRLLGPMLRGEPVDLLATVPAQGSLQTIPACISGTGRPHQSAAQLGPPKSRP